MPDDMPPPPPGTAPGGAPGPASVLPPPVPYPPAMPPWSTPPASPPPPWGTTPPPPGDKHPGWRPRRLRAAAALAVLFVLAGAAAVGSWLSTSGSSSTPGSSAAAGGPSTGAASEAALLVSGALSAAEAAGSFHYVSSSTSTGVTQLTVGDAGPRSGRQNIDLNGDAFTVLVVGATAYFQGDARAMAENLSVPGSVAQAHAGQWISLVAGDVPYQSVYAAVTTSDALNDNVTFTPRIVLGASTIAGQRVVAARGPMQNPPGSSGTARGTATLYFSASGRHLPVRYVERGTLRGNDGSVTTLQFRIDFSSWGESVQVPVPPGAVPFASLGVSGNTGQGSPPTTLVA